MLLGLDICKGTQKRDSQNEARYSQYTLLEGERQAETEKEEREMTEKEEEAKEKGERDPGDARDLPL